MAVLDIENNIISTEDDHRKTLAWCVYDPHVKIRSADNYLEIS